MVEQTLTAHPRIAAGDELPIINELTGLMPRMLNSPLAYPEALAELWLGDQVEGLDNLRDYYLQRARQLGALRERRALVHRQDAAQRDASRPDRADLPESADHPSAAPSARRRAVGLLQPSDARLLLRLRSRPASPGTTCWSWIWSSTTGARCTLRYLAVRYEDVVDDQEASVRDMLAFHRRAVRRRCLDFHENRRYARTASYAQVTEKLYDRSRYRYRAYREQLAPVIPILEPVCQRLGYSIDTA